MHKGSFSEKTPEEMQFASPRKHCFAVTGKGRAENMVLQPQGSRASCLLPFPRKRIVLSQAVTCQNDINTPNMSKQSVQLRFLQEVWSE